MIPYPIKSSLIFSPFVWLGGHPQRSFPRHVQRFRRPKIHRHGFSANKWWQGKHSPHSCRRSLLAYLNAEPSSCRSRAGYLGEKRIIISKLPALEARREATVGYSQILKELERVWLERDTFKARLTSLDENPEKILKKQKASKSSHSGNTLKSSSSHSGLRSDEPAQYGSRRSKASDDETSIRRLRYAPSVRPFRQTPLIVFFLQCREHA